MGTLAGRAITTGLAATAIALAGCDAGALPEADEPIAVEDPSPTVQEEGAELELEVHGLGVTIDELPAVWNEAVSAYGAGYTLPTSIDADDEFGGLLLADLSIGDAILFLAWDPVGGQVTEIGLDGPVDVEAVAIDLMASAGAMVYATSDRDLIEAEDFLVDELMAGVQSFQQGDFISELVEEPGRVYRFSLGGSFASWDVTGQP